MIISLQIQDFDGGIIGQEITQGLKSQPILIDWTVVSTTQFPSGANDLAHAVREQHTWVIVAS